MQPSAARAARRGAVVADRDRRSALRVAMGPRLPSGISRARRAARAASRACRAWRSPRPRRRRRATRSSRGSSSTRAAVFVASFDRPNIRYRVVERRATRAASCCVPRRSIAARRASCTASRASKTERDRRVAARGGLRRAAVSRRTDRPRPAPNISADSSPKTAWSSSRRSRSAWASTSPTCASSRISICRRASRRITRRPGRAGRDGEPADAWMIYGLAGRRAAARARRSVRSRRAAQAARARASSTRCSAGVRSTECRRRPLLAYFGERRARAAVRQLRQLPRAARDLGRHGGRAQAPVRDLSDRAVVRRRARRRRARRPRHGKGRAPPARGSIRIRTSARISSRPRGAH